MLDEQLGDLVAQGRTADIHAWQDDEHVIKLYQDWFQLEWIQEEASRSAAVQALDIPTPAVGELVQVNGRNGLIFERIYGDNMLAMLRQNPALVSTYATRLADLHKRLHSLDAQPAIPLQHEKLERNIGRATQLSDSLKKTLTDKLHSMPAGRAVCHGDFHPGNVVVTTKGDASEVIVDWNDCSLGNPLADVARATILFLGGITGNETPDLAFEQLVRDCHDQYLARYFEGMPGARDEYEQWMPIIAGARLSENIVALEPWLLAEANKILTV